MKKGYLVVSRKVGDRIKIGDDIEIMLTDLDFHRMRADIAIRAPKNMKIERMATHMEMEREKEKQGG